MIKLKMTGYCVALTPSFMSLLHSPNHSDAANFDAAISKKKNCTIRVSTLNNNKDYDCSILNH